MLNKSSLFNFKTRTSAHSTLVCDDASDAAAVAAAATEAELQKKIDAAVAAGVATATAGLKAKNEELLGQERKLKDTLKSFEGVDPEAYKKFKDRMDNDEDTKLLSEGKKEQVVAKYTERMRQEHQAQLAAAAEKVEAANKRAKVYESNVLDNHIRSVASGMHPGAVEDALLHARQIFSLDANGKAVQLGSDGLPVAGKDGVNPFTPGEWMELQKETKPHWFLSSTTGGGKGDVVPGPNGSKTIKRDAFDRMTGIEKANVMKSGVQLID